MRIIGGEWGGQPLYTPKNSEIRPTSDLLRGALFNILDHRFGHTLGNLVDFFAGTGALCFEAFSRGATRALLFEADPKAQKIIQKNAEKFSVLNAVTVEKNFNIQSWSKVLERWTEKEGPVRTLFCDPPYGKKLVQKSINLLEKVSPTVFHPDVLFIFELSMKDDLPDTQKLEAVFEKKHGSSVLQFYKMRPL